METMSSGFFFVQQTCRTCSGEGFLNKDPCGTCRGAGTTRKERNIDVTIPEGIESGTILRVNKEGNAGVKGGPAGHLFVRVDVEESREFARDGADIHVEVPLSYIQAILGDTLKVRTLWGEQELKINPGTQVWVIAAIVVG